MAEKEFPDYPGGAYGRYLSGDINTLLNTFTRGDEGRDMSFKELTSNPSSAVRPQYNEDTRSDSERMQGLLKYNYATADATGVAHDNIDAELAQNRQDKLEKLIHQSKEEGSIRALPYLQTAEGQQTMLDIAMGSAFPGSAIGSMSKASLTGGGATAKSLQKYLQQLFKKSGSGGPRDKILRHDKMPAFDKEVIGRIDAETEVGVARSAWEKAMKKWGIKPNERTVNDPVTELLRSQKSSRFSPHRKN